MRRCQLDAALLPPLAITAESLLGPANGSLGLKPSEPFVFKHLIARLRYPKLKMLGINVCASVAHPRGLAISP